MKNIRPEASLYIDGEWMEGVSVAKNINPSDIHDRLGDFAQASEAQMQQAIRSAHAAQPLWARVSLEGKQQVLHAIGKDLMAKSGEIGKLLSREEGKTLAEGVGEVYRAGQFFQYYAAEVLRQIGDLVDSVREGVRIEVTREPLGVVGIISPWNFPVATASWKIAPALAFGNSVIWKPANLTPASAVALSQVIAEQTALPKGTFNLVIGSGRTIGNVLIQDKTIGGVSFTGSVEIGQQIARATAPNFVRAQLEMGSKNALYIDSSADLAVAVQASIVGAFSGTGQKCTASSRLIVHRDICDAYVEALIAKMNTLRVGHALEEGVFMGPVVDEKQLKANLEWVKKAQAEGAVLGFGGERLHLEHEGYYMAPTLLLDTQNAWPVNQTEIFAPLASVIRVEDLDEAIATVNDTDYGLVSGIVTQDLKNSTLFKRQVQTGCVSVNLPTAGTDYHVPFGGRKQSSFGAREQGQYAKEFYTIVKTAYQFA